MSADAVVFKEVEPFGAARRAMAGRLQVSDHVERPAEVRLNVHGDGVTATLMLSHAEARALAEWILADELKLLREITALAADVVRIHCGDHLTPEAIGDALEEMACEGKLSGPPDAVAALVARVRSCEVSS